MLILFKGETMKITVRIKHVYGIERIYPVCEKAEIFCFLAGSKTLNKSDISKIEQLGFSVEVQRPTI